MLLTKEERNKFAAYLMMLADSDMAILRQYEQLNVPKELIERTARMANARRLVASDLLTVEEGGTT